MREIPVTCSRDCSGGCPLLAKVEDGQVKSIINNPSGKSWMNGCVNGFQMGRLAQHPERLRAPLIRSGKRGSGQFREVEWEEALDLVAEKLIHFRDQYGHLSVLNLPGTGSLRCSLHNSYSLSNRFFSLFGGATNVSGNYSSAAAGFAVPYMLGTKGFGVDPETLLHSELVILWGSNMVDTHEGCGTASLIKAVKEAGKQVIVIDPRRSATVKQLATQWVACRPGTDTALMLAVLYVLIEESLLDREWIARVSVGFEELEAWVLGNTDGQKRDPKWAEKICGTPAAEIHELARLYGTTRPAALLPGLSMQRTLGGEDSHRLSIVLQTVTGNLGQKGGTTGSAISRISKPRVGSLPVPPAPSEETFPILQWPDAILQGKAGGYPSDIKMLYTVASNYLGQGSDIHKNISAFEKLDFAVCHDYLLTPTAMHCDVVFPATTFLERSDILTPDTGNYLLYSNQALDPFPGARHDYDILCALAERLGFGKAFSEGRDETAWLNAFLMDSDVRDVDAFKRTGLFFAEDQQRVGLSEFVKNPQSCPLSTPSGLIEISSREYSRQTGFSPFPIYQEELMAEAAASNVDYPLQLITPKSRMRIHSQGGNPAWQKKPQTLMMNPLDAQIRGISNGDLVLLYNQFGKMRIAVSLMEDIMPGVLSMTEGIWPKFDANGVEIAGSANVLSSTKGSRPSYGSTTHSINVECIVENSRS